MESLYHCAAYYPELWPESDIENDIFYMKKAGINLVRMGEFAWHFMEPAEDQINISFFVRIVNLLYKNGIKTHYVHPNSDSSHLADAQSPGTVSKGSIRKPLYPRRSPACMHQQSVSAKTRVNHHRSYG